MRSIMCAVAIVSVLAGPSWAQGDTSFRCPRGGTSVTLSTGAVLNWSDAIDPVGCPVTAGDRPETRLFNIYWTLRPDSQVEVRRLMPALFPLVPGKTVKMEVYLQPTGGGEQWPYIETWTYLRTEPVTVPAGTFNAFVFERTQEATAGRQYAGKWTMWMDTESRVYVKSVHQHIRGRPISTGNYEAVSLTVPRPLPAAPATPQQRPGRVPPRG